MRDITKALLLRTGMASGPLQNTADAKPVRSVGTQPGTVFFQQFLSVQTLINELK